MKKIVSAIIFLSLFATAPVYAGSCVNCGPYVIFTICNCASPQYFESGLQCDPGQPGSVGCHDGAEIAIRFISMTPGVYFANMPLDDQNLLAIFEETFSCNLCSSGPNGNRSYGINTDGHYDWTQFLYKRADGTQIDESEATKSIYDYDSTNLIVNENARFVELITANDQREVSGYKILSSKEKYWTIKLPLMVVDWEETKNMAGQMAQMKIDFVLYSEDSICKDCNIVCECLVDLFEIFHDSLLYVTTLQSGSITDSSAILAGRAIARGELGIISKGICYSTVPDPTVDDYVSETTSGEGDFSAAISGLNPFTTYYYRAFAINRETIVYGEEKSFTTRCTGGLEVFLPHITAKDPSWKDYLQVDNNSSQAACFGLSLYHSEKLPFSAAATGVLDYTNDYAIPAMGHAIIELKSLAPLASCGRVTYSNQDLLFRLSYENMGDSQQAGGGLAEFKIPKTLDDKLTYYFSDFAPSLSTKGMVVTNMSLNETDVTITAEGSGEELGSLETTIPAYGKLVGSYTSWFPDIAFQDIRRMVVTSDSPQLCGLVQNADDYISNIVFTVAEPDSGSSNSNAYIPHITAGSPEWIDYLQVDNNDNTNKRSFLLTLYADGAVVYSKTHWVSAKGHSLINLKSLAPTAECGKVTSSWPNLYFRLSFENIGGQFNSGGGLAEFKLTDTLSDVLSYTFSDFASAITVKGAAITNMGSTPLTVTLYAMGDSSTLGQYNTIIDGYGKLVGSCQDLFPALLSSQIRRIIVSSPEPKLCGLVQNANSQISTIVFTAPEPVVNFVPMN
ncbi:MAG: hypothetical protein V1793_14790 [Pseudomonadota bacterium]